MSTRSVQAADEDHEIYPGGGVVAGQGCDCGGRKLADIESVRGAFRVV